MSLPGCWGQRMPQNPSLSGTAICTVAEQSGDSVWPQHGHFSWQLRDFIPLPEVCAATPAHTNISFIVSSCFFIFFLGYMHFVSTLAPPWGQQLSHLQCSLLPPWLHTSPTPGGPSHVALPRKALHLPLKLCQPSSSSQGGMPSCKRGTWRTNDACAV